MSSISNYIQNNYNIVYQSKNLKSVDQASIYCLPEVHSSLKQKAINAKFIDLFDSKVLVAVEEFRSMKEFKFDENIQTYLLKNPKKAIGWDVGTLPELLGLEDGVVKKYEIFKQKEVQWFKKANELENADRHDGATYATLFNQATGLRQQVRDIATEMNLVAMLDEEKIRDTFQLRNDSMISTLEKTHGSTRVVVGGQAHFYENEQTIEDKRLTVQPLRDYLEDKNAVIFSHKEVHQECCIQ